MAKRQATAATRDKFSAPLDADLYYVPDDLKPFCVRIDSLVLDPANVKDHGDADLDAHQASLRDFGIRRLVVVRKSNRQIEAGNGTVEASKRNGWEYVPVLFIDDDATKAQAFALADNAVATLADWNEERLKELTSGALEWAGELDVSGLVNSVLDNLNYDESESEEPAEEEKPAASGPVEVPRAMKSYRLTVTCLNEKQQLDLVAELQGRGLEVRVSDKLVQ